MSVPREPTEEPVLKPCPFCGGRPEHRWHTGDAGWLECEHCEAVGPQASSDNWDTVIAHWNTRAAPETMSGKAMGVEWSDDISLAPHACHVLAARWVECEWAYAVVASPPSKPFTHWQMLPDPPGATLSEGRDGERARIREEALTDAQVMGHHRYRNLHEDFVTVETDLRNIAILVGHHYNSCRPVAPAVEAALLDKQGPAR